MLLGALGTVHGQFIEHATLEQEPRERRHELVAARVDNSGLRRGGLLRHGCPRLATYTWEKYYEFQYIGTRVAAPSRRRAGTVPGTGHAGSRGARRGARTAPRGAVMSG